MPKVGRKHQSVRGGSVENMKPRREKKIECLAVNAEGEIFNGEEEGASSEGGSNAGLLSIGAEDGNAFSFFFLNFVRAAKGKMLDFDTSDHFY